MTKTRVRELVRTALTYGYYQEASDRRSYPCPLDVSRHGLAHRVTLTYWVARPPKRADIERAFAEHYADDCPHTTQEA